MLFSLCTPTLNLSLLPTNSLRGRLFWLHGATIIVPFRCGLINCKWVQETRPSFEPAGNRPQVIIDMAFGGRSITLADFLQLIECVLARPRTAHTSECSSSIKNDCCGNKCSTPNWISGCGLQTRLSGEISRFSHDFSGCNGFETIFFFWLNPGS